MDEEQIVDAVKTIEKILRDHFFEKFHDGINKVNILVEVQGYKVRITDNKIQ